MILKGAGEIGGFTNYGCLGTSNKLEWGYIFVNDAPQSDKSALAHDHSGRENNSPPNNRVPPDARSFDTHLGVSASGPRSVGEHNIRTHPAPVFQNTVFCDAAVRLESYSITDLDVMFDCA